MNVELNEKTRKIHVTISDIETDTVEAFELKKMMQMQGWEIYKKYQMNIAKQLLDRAKESAFKRTRKDLAPEACAMIAGFDFASEWVNDFVRTPDEYNELKNKLDNLSEQIQEEQ